MTELELANWRDKTHNRLVEKLNMRREHADFVIALQRHTHSTLGAALYEINDFMDEIGI